MLDYKKEYKDLYQPSTKPSIVAVPKMRFLAVSGKGNPNAEGGEYKAALGALYAVAYTLKMSYKTDYAIDGFEQYVVPPLEGLWKGEIDYAHKENLEWISLIRLPDFISDKDVEWAKTTAEQKKKIDCSKVKVFGYDEGECVQIMHIGSYDDEPASVAKMHEFAETEGYKSDFGERLHHEIYLSDPRRCEPSKLKTVIRHPVAKK